MATPANDRIFTAETFLWSLLVLLVAANETDWVIVAATAIIFLRHPTPRPNRVGRANDDGEPWFRRLPNADNCIPVVLVPTLLASLRLEDWKPYVLASCWLVLSHSDQWLLLGLLISAWLDQPKPVFFFAIYKLFQFGLERAKSLHQVFTVAEWRIVSSLMAVTVTEYLRIVLVQDNGELLDHQLVALSGLMGSGIAFCIVDKVLYGQDAIFVYRLVLLAALPLLSVDLVLSQVASDLPLPRSLFWIVQFLLDAEGDLPRYYFLAYWAVVLAVCFAFAPSLPSSGLSHTAVVVRRKWFHFVAVLLFVPVTASAPQLQSLAYAVASALLLLAECLRTKCKALGQFYDPYLDKQKGEHSNQERMVISHLALIVGCAAPLWLSECLPQTSDTRFLRTFLAHWGVLTLGVGDAMGALVGSLYGQTRWWGPLHQTRTLEGSAAMFVSMLLACGIGYVWMDTADRSQLEPRQIGSVVLTLQFVTLLEAFTLQLDNLILPLAGSAVLLGLLHSQT